MKAMILAAGIGSRLKPLTDNTPKALVKVGPYRMLDLTLSYLQKHGVNEFIINVHHLADQIMEYVADKRWQGIKIHLSDETNELMNTGGGLMKASEFLSAEDNFVLMAVDILTDLDLSKMIAAHIQSGALVTLAVKNRQTSRALLFDAKNNLAGWEHSESGMQKLVPGRTFIRGFGFSGIHVIQSSIFDSVVEKGAFSIVDLYLRLAEKHDIKMFDHSDGKWMEFGRAERIKTQAESKDFNYLTKHLGLQE
jgi:MurNAc alpha-1-phosphate uridylyltransferase